MIQRIYAPFREISPTVRVSASMTFRSRRRFRTQRAHRQQPDDTVSLTFGHKASTPIINQCKLIFRNLVHPHWLATGHQFHQARVLLYGRRYRWDRIARRVPRFGNDEAAFRDNSDSLFEECQVGRVARDGEGGKTAKRGGGVGAIRAGREEGLFKCQSSLMRVSVFMI